MTKDDILFELHSDSRYALIDGMWKYRGALGKDKRKPMPRLAYRAYTAWSAQGHRCKNPKSAAYQYYGKLGVGRLWSADDCISFYLNALLGREIWSRPAMSRKADVGNYELGNVTLEEQAENSGKIRRTEKMRLNSVKQSKLASQCSAVNRARPVVLVKRDDPSCILRFKSGKEAREKLNKAIVFSSYIQRKCMTSINKEWYYVGYADTPIQRF